MDFWLFCEAREQIRLNREAGLPRSEWTSDEVLKKFRFTNIDRQYDYGSRLLWDASEWCEDDLLLVHLCFAYRYLGSPVWLPPALAPMQIVTERSLKIKKRQDRGEVCMNTRAYQAIVPLGMSMIDFVIDHGQEMSDLILRHCSPLRCGVSEPIPPLTLVNALGEKSRELGYHAAWFQAMETVKDIMHLKPNWVDPRGAVRLGPGAVTGLMEHLGRMPGRKEAMKIVADMVDEGINHHPGSVNWTYDVIEHALCEYGKYCRSARGERKGGDWEPTH
jgi:hypothetical protein